MCYISWRSQPNLPVKQQLHCVNNILTDRLVLSPCIRRYAEVLLYTSRVMALLPLTANNCRITWPAPQTPVAMIFIYVAAPAVGSPPFHEDCTNTYAVNIVSWNETELYVGISFLQFVFFKTDIDKGKNYLAILVSIEDEWRGFV